MRSDEFEPFSVVIQDLCAAFDRQCTDAKVRVFWETLKHLHIHDVKRSAESWRRSQRKMPTPRDLIPERPAAPPKPIEPEPQFSKWAMAANKILLAFAYLDARRGLEPIAVWENPKPGLPLGQPRLVDGERLQRCLAANRDYIRMAEEAEAAGEPMDGQEFQAMCREGFEKLLGTVA